MEPNNDAKKKGWPRLLAILVLLVAFLAALSFPERRAEMPASVSIVPVDSTGAPFKWDADALWAQLETRFVEAREATCTTNEANSSGGIGRINAIVRELARSNVGPSDPRWDAVETALFEVAPIVAACPTNAADLVDAYSELRAVLKEQSTGWDMTDRRSRVRLYRLLYGGRAAVEEVILQMSFEDAAEFALVHGEDEPSESPSATVRGVQVFSGDILVSRGGFPTSALIARGSDYPGNFSHVALLHVTRSDEPSIVEAHIDRGLTVTTVEKYLSDKKLRIMLLRPRRDLPVIANDPRASHLAASRIRARALNSHVPYDFEMDYRDDSKLFCSEVASSAYREQGIDLWMGISRISAKGLRRWLSGFGVEHFETQEPSDLEYDPQLVVVAEWRDPLWLFGDHIDNAVTDAMLEGANRGDTIEYPALLLPFARLAKGYSFVLNKLRRVGPVPEGMSAPAALRNRSFVRRHNKLVRDVRDRAELFHREKGYRAPYWQLVEMARAAVADEE